MVAVSPWVRRGPWLGLGLLVLWAMWVGGSAAWLVPWAGLIGVLAWGGRRLARLRALGAQVQRAQELVALGHSRAGLRAGWRLVERLRAHPLLQHRAVLVLTQALDEVGAHGAAVVAYDRLLEDLPTDHPGAVQLKVYRAIAWLFEERLADADEALRRLRGPVSELEGRAVGSAYRFGLLFQSAATAHYDEAIAESEDLIEALRPWGVSAGYGYGLLAWCYHRRAELGGSGARQADAEDSSAAADRAAAAVWWERAEALVPRAQLVGRLPRLAEMLGGGGSAVGGGRSEEVAADRAGGGDGENG